MNFRTTIFIAILQCGTAFGAVGQIDQQYVPPTSDNWTDIVAASPTIPWGDEWSQVFTAGMSGRFTGFDVWVERDADVTQPLFFDIRTTKAGKPTEPDTGPNILVSGSIAADSVPLGTSSNEVLPTFLHVDIDTLLINITAGDTLAITLSTITNPATFHHYWWRGNVQGGYASGAAFGRAYGGSIKNAAWQQYSIDEMFRTYVLAIPEPSTTWLCVLGLTGYMSACRRRPTSHNRVQRGPRPPLDTPASAATMRL